VNGRRRRILYNQFDIIIIIIITILCLERCDVNAGSCYIDWTPPPPPSADKDVVSGRRNERGGARARANKSWGRGVRPATSSTRRAGWWEGGARALPAKNRHDDMPPVRGSNVPQHLALRHAILRAAGAESFSEKRPTADA